jgi:hypothetical protein
MVSPAAAWSTWWCRSREWQVFLLARAWAGDSAGRATQQVGRDGSRGVQPNDYFVIAGPRELGPATTGPAHARTSLSLDASVRAGSVALRRQSGRLFAG